MQYAVSKILSEKRRRKNLSDTWHDTRDIFLWHMTRDMWHMTCDMWWGMNILPKFQLPSNFGLGVMILLRLGGKGWRTERINDKGVIKTAPATRSVKNKCKDFRLTLPPMSNIQVFIFNTPFPVRWCKECTLAWL